MSWDSELKRLYGLSKVGYLAILDHQNGRCAICRRKPSARDPKLSVDHDHKTGLVRGLLCRRCNYQFLGMFGDNPEFYHRAADYLRTPPAVETLGHHYTPDAPPRRDS